MGGYETSSVDTSYRLNRERCATFIVGEIVYVDFNKTKTFLGAVTSKSPGIGVIRVLIMDESFNSHSEISVPVSCVRKITYAEENENPS